MDSFFPEGLTKNVFAFLSKCVDEIDDVPLANLLQGAEDHLEAVRKAKTASNPLLNVRLAEAIVDVIREVVEEWETIPAHARSWCRGMIQYFISSEDEENDFDSPIGFEDDAEVLNSCMRLAGRADLCIDPEDYDDVC